MSQQNMRKEPIFGEPTIAKVDSGNVESKPATATNNGYSNKFNFSLHSSKSPGHTFTPVMKRPVAKAQSFASMEEKAEQHQINNTPEQVKTAPAFAFAPVVDQAEASPEHSKVVESTTSETNIKMESKTENTPPPTMNSQTIERVIPTTQSEPKKSFTEKVAPQYRRLILVGLLALALLLVFVLLKPNTPETVEQLEEQGNSLPIEFRPVDEAEAKRAEEEAKALAAQQAQAEQATQTLNAPSTPAPQVEQPSTSEVSVSAAPIVPAAPISAPNVEVSKPAVEITKPATVEASKPAVEITKPATSGSVIYQAETEKTQVEKKVEKVKPVTQSKPEVKVEKVQPVKQKAEVVTAKPVAASATTSVGAASTKTLTVPKGVSLMQVFRDNNLNISDVNAMSKVNKAVSNLKVGEKVTVRLDKNNRVVEMRVKAGTYVRQANGTYSFK